MTYLELYEKSNSVEITYQVNSNIYFAFQCLSSDYNPLHTDELFAQSKGFPSRVMYGNILNGFVSHFVGMALPCRDVIIQTQDIQFRKPFYLDDVIILNASIENSSASVEIIKYKLKFYRKYGDNSELIATGHVQIGMINNK